MSPTDWALSLLGIIIGLSIWASNNTARDSRRGRGRERGRDGDGARQWEAASFVNGGREGGGVLRRADSERRGSREVQARPGLLLLLLHLLGRRRWLGSSACERLGLRVVIVFLLPERFCQSLEPYDGLEAREASPARVYPGQAQEETGQGQ